MKTYITLFILLALASLLAGLFGTTPLGEPATHQLYLSGLCWLLALLFAGEHLKKMKKEQNE